MRDVVVCADPDGVADAVAHRFLDRLAAAQERGETPDVALTGVIADGDVKLFVNRGRRGGIEEEDLRWALTEGAVIPDEDIKSIRVLDRFSFVELKSEHAEKAVEFLDGTKLKGKQIRMEVARS